MRNLTRPFGRKAPAPVPGQRAPQDGAPPSGPGGDGHPAPSMTSDPFSGGSGSAPTRTRRLGTVPLVALAAVVLAGGVGAGYLLLSPSSDDVDGSAPVRPQVTRTASHPARSSGSASGSSSGSAGASASGSPADGAAATGSRNPFAAPGGTGGPTTRPTGSPTGPATGPAATQSPAGITPSTATATATATVTATVSATATRTVTSTVTSTVTATVTPGP